MEGGRGRGLKKQTEQGPSQARAETPASEPSSDVSASSSGTVVSKGRGRGLQSAQATEASSGGRGRGKGLSKAPVPCPSSPLAAAPSPSPAVSSGISFKTLADALERSIEIEPLYKRPDKGTKGRQIALVSNLFKLTFTDMVWHRYDVKIDPIDGSEQTEGKLNVKNRDRVQSRRLNKEIMRELFRKHSKDLQGQRPSYDGRNTLICARRFFETHTFVVHMPKNERGRAKEFCVKMQHTSTIDVNQIKMFYDGRRAPLNVDILQAINIVIDSALGEIYTAVNRSFYASGIRGKSLGGGKELRHGMYTSAIYAEWQPLLLVDKSNTAFYRSCPLIEYIEDFLRDSTFKERGIDLRHISALSKDLKNLMVRLIHTGVMKRSVRIDSVTDEPANCIRFLKSDGSKESVADYFGKNYTKLKYPHLPCIKVLKANKTKTDYYPLEVCEVKENQPYRKKLNPNQTQQMIKMCQDPPHARICDAERNAKIISDTSAANLSQHGIGLDLRPVRTIGRQIDSPKILVKRQEIQVRNGCWTQNEFHVSAALDQWLVVDCENCRGQERKLAELLYAEARKMKMSSVCEPIRILPGDRLSAEGMLSKVKADHRDKSKPILAIIILGKQTSYSQIKNLSETTPEFNGIITQCVKGENVINPKKLKPMFVNNLLKKINVKLGGKNNAISAPPKRFSKDDCIIIGADVTHPGVGDIMTPSIAAVVGSLDDIPSLYHTITSVQCNESTNRIEYIVDLKNIVRELLIKFYHYRRLKPKHIYYLRDGVSEGQFDEVRRREINAIREACQSLEADYKPPMTVIVAQKRHHVRFNLEDRNLGGKEGNVPPGVYIDRDVVHPINFDLYMYSHRGLIGTSRPTHYHLIHADVPISTDELTEFIYHLCHTYARSTSSVSIPAPIYYAHHAAFRAKEHVKGSLYLSGCESVASGETGLIDLSQYQKTCTVNENYRSLLYYA